MHYCSFSVVIISHKKSDSSPCYLDGFRNKLNLTLAAIRRFQFQKCSKLFIRTHNETLTHAIRDLWRVEGAYVRAVIACGIAPLPPYAASRIAAPFFSATLPPREVCDAQFLHVLPYGAPFSKALPSKSAPLKNLTSPMCHNLCAEMRTSSSRATAEFSCRA